MTETKTKRKRAPGAGRPAYPDDERAKNVTIRLTKVQRDMLKVLGGGEWVRKMIDIELKKVFTDQS